MKHKYKNLRQFVVYGLKPSNDETNLADAYSEYENNTPVIETRLDFMRAIEEEYDIVGNSVKADLV